MRHAGKWALTLSVQQRASTGIRNSDGLNANFVQLVQASPLTVKVVDEEEPRIQFAEVKQLDPFVGVGSDLIAVQPIGSFGESEDYYSLGTVIYGEADQTISFDVAQGILITSSSLLSIDRQHYCWNNGMPTQLSVDGGVGQCPVSPEQSKEGIYITATVVSLDNLDDLDGDGVGYVCDAFPDDATESRDDDGDGIGDLCDAFPGSSANNPVIGDGSELTDDEYFSAGALFRCLGDNKQDAFGQAVHYGNDYNNDGVADFVVGASKWDAPKQPSLKPRKDTGAVYLISGKDAAVIKMLQGQFAKDEFGSAIAFADMNGDGVEELVVGAPKFSGAGLKLAGRVYVYGTTTWNEVDKVDGDIANGLFGQSLLALDTAEGAAAVVLAGNTYWLKACRCGC